MTIASSTNKHIYQGNGATKEWPFTFKIFNESDIQVYITDASGTETKLTTGYRVDTQNGYVEYPYPSGDPLPSGWKITLLRIVHLVQETDLVNQGPFFAEVIEESLDRLTVIDQQQQEVLDRAIRLPVSAGAVSAELPVPTPLHSFRWNAAGTALETTLDPATVLPAVQNVALQAANSAASAATSASAAATSATNAATSASAAATYATIVAPKRVTYIQSSPSTTWSIEHNMNTYPSVMVVDTGGNTVIGDIQYNSANQLTIRFLQATAGTAYLNGVKNQFIFMQSTPLNSWVIQHDLNCYPQVIVTDTAGNVINGDITYNSPNQVTVSFSAPIAGRAYFI